MKKSKAAIAAALCGITMTLAPVSAFAAEVSETTVQASTQQTVTLEKTEAVTPTFTVSVPATLNLGKDAQDMTFTLTQPDSNTFIPSGKKVSVAIDSAGYPSKLTDFVLWNKKSFTEAQYQVYDSDRAASPTIYKIGDEIVNWTGSNHGTQTRRAKVLNYDSIVPGTYEGVINYAISYTDNN